MIFALRMCYWTRYDVDLAYLWTPCSYFALYASFDPDSALVVSLLIELNPYATVGVIRGRVVDYW